MVDRPRARQRWRPPLSVDRVTGSTLLLCNQRLGRRLRRPSPRSKRLLVGPPSHAPTAPRCATTCRSRTRTIPLGTQSPCRSCRTRSSSPACLLLLSDSLGATSAAHYPRRPTRGNCRARRIDCLHIMGLQLRTSGTPALCPGCHRRGTYPATQAEPLHTHPVIPTTSNLLLVHFHCRWASPCCLVHGSNDRQHHCPSLF
jgi:hypothetical protein